MDNENTQPKKENVLPPTVTAQGTAYSRAQCLYAIIIQAAFQLRQDCDGLEQEPMALASRVLMIKARCLEISANDPLLKG